MAHLDAAEIDRRRVADSHKAPSAEEIARRQAADAHGPHGAPDAAEVARRTAADASKAPTPEEVERRRVADGVNHPGQVWNVNAQVWTDVPGPIPSAAEAESRRVAEASKAHPGTTLTSADLKHADAHKK